MADYQTELSQSGTTLYLKAADGFQRSTIFGAATTDVHQFTGSVRVSGTLHANEYRVITVTAASGSTFFGNSSADSHQRTGSMLVQTISSSAGATLVGGLITSTIKASGSSTLKGALSSSAGATFGGPTIVSNTFSVSGNIQLGNAAADVLTATSQITASEGMQVADDKRLTFGSGNDSYIYYAEATTDHLTISGSKVDLVLGNSARLTASVIDADSKLFLTTDDSSALVNTAVGAVVHGTDTANVSSRAPLTTFEVHYTGSGNPTGLASNVGGGELVFFGTGSTVKGYLYYLNSHGGWDRANAAGTGSLGSGSANKGAGNASLLAIANGTNPLSDGMLVRGYWNVQSSWVHAWITGSAVYVHSASAGGAAAGVIGGQFSASAPSTTDSYVRIVGYCTPSEKVIYFNPDKTWVEIN